MAEYFSEVGTRKMREDLVFSEILKCEGLSPTAKLIYFYAHLFRPTSMESLAEQSKLDRNTVSKACIELQKNGWLKTVSHGQRKVPVPVVPHSVQQIQAKFLETAFALAPQKGEFLTKGMLDILVPSRDYVDNARPDFLANPLTGESLEYDRYYLEGVAFEFNGSQHYGPTQKYPNKEEFKSIRARDLVKKGLSEEHGIILVTVSFRDLTLTRMQEKIPPRLPSCQVDTDGPYVRTLERLSREYRATIAKIEKGQAQTEQI